MTPLEKIVRERIVQKGAMLLSEYMDIALGHPEHGYYMKKDPLGAAGDFTTAPEISQMFGELIGAWCAQVWINMGKPARFSLVELGPGRGTLMSDLLRATKNINGFHDAASVHFVEMSPVLQAKQKETLKGYDIQWHSDVDAIKEEVPVIIVANEFFDALPVDHIQFKNKEIFFKFMILNEDKKLQFKYLRNNIKNNNYLTDIAYINDIKDGDYEFSESSAEYFRKIQALIKRNSGASLIIDYGYTWPEENVFPSVDTFQALYKHKYCDPLCYIGDADLTAHVDFTTLSNIAQAESGDVTPVVSQGAFLRQIGLEARAQRLHTEALKSGDKEAANKIMSAFHRLSAPEEMGHLFKVLGVSHGLSKALPGFES